MLSKILKVELVKLGRYFSPAEKITIDKITVKISYIPLTAGRKAFAPALMGPDTNNKLIYKDFLQLHVALDIRRVTMAVP